MASIPGFFWSPGGSTPTWVPTGSIVPSPSVPPSPLSTPALPTARIDALLHVTNLDAETLLVMLSDTLKKDSTQFKGIAVCPTSFQILINVDYNITALPLQHTQQLSGWFPSSYVYVPPQPVNTSTAQTPSQLNGQRVAFSTPQGVVFGSVNPGPANPSPVKTDPKYDAHCFKCGAPGWLGFNQVKCSDPSCK